MSKILNFGSLNLDYVYHVRHFAKPGETVTSTSRDVNCGGKGLNQSIALSRSGASVFHAGKIGADGLMLKEFLSSNGVNTDNVFVSDCASGHAVIEVDSSGQNSIILYPGANATIDGKMIAAVLKNFAAGDYLVLQNEISNIPDIMTAAHDMGMFIVMNPSPVTPQLLTYPLEYVSLLVVNEIEGEALSGCVDPLMMADGLYARYGADILLTLGSCGAIYKSSSVTLKYGIHRAPVVDTTAAGDTMLGFFTGLLSTGCDPYYALSTAAKASSIAVSRKGAAASVPCLADALDCPYEYIDFAP